MPFEKTPKKWSFFSPYLTFADEASASLDVESETYVQKALSRLIKKNGNHDCPQNADSCKGIAFDCIGKRKGG